MLNSCRDQHARHETVAGRREKSLFCDPGSELRLVGRELEYKKILKNGMEKNALQ